MFVLLTEVNGTMLARNVPLLVLLAILLHDSVHPLDNGLARTPPMGWLSWQRFGCNIDCKNDPDNCISENLYKNMADIMVSEGYKDVGYEYVNIDDCWSAKERDPKTLRLLPDPERFPSGIKALADYVHSKGLKLGIYGDMGNQTCGGYPGNKFWMNIDAQTFADWGVDSFKMDGCGSDPKEFRVSYTTMEFWLKETGRPILYSCSWPAYQAPTHPKWGVPYRFVALACNTWRNYNDIEDSWDSVKSIIDYYGNNTYDFAKWQGPGAFNDPDMIIVGSTGLSDSEERVQMAMWAMFSAPLLLSADLRSVRQSSKELMQHKGVIAVNQDPLGKMAKRVYQPRPTISVWVKPTHPEGSYAMTVLNTGHIFHGDTITFLLKDIGITLDKTPLHMVDVFTGQDYGTIHTDTHINVTVDESSVFFVRLIPHQDVINVD